MTRFHLRALLDLLTIEGQFILFLQFLHLLFFHSRVLDLLYLSFPTLYLSFSGNYVIKRVQYNFYASNCRRIRRSVLLISVYTLHCHQIVYSISNNSTKDRMFPVEVLAFSKSDKKLGPIGILTTISHSYQSSSGEFQPLMWFIFEGRAINGLSSCSSSCGISTLNHESRDKSVKDGVIIVFIDSQLQEIPDSERSFPAPQFYFQFSMRSKDNDFGVSWGLFLDARLHNYKSQIKSMID